MSFMFPKEQDNPFIPEGPVPGELSTGELMSAAFRLETKRTSLGGVAGRFAEENRANRIESAVLSPEDATKKYGIQGQLSFSSPIKESVAQVLRRRKEEELEYEKILATADGFTQKAGTFTAALASSLFDPLTLGASAIPILGEARWAQLIGRYGVVRGRVIGGAIEGGVGNALMEPMLLYQAHRDQMNYTAVDSLINVGMGITIGGGIGLLAGRWNQHVAGVRQKTHINALKTATNQLAAGKNVEVEPIIKASSVPEKQSTFIDMDASDDVDVDDLPFVTSHTPDFFFDKNKQYDPATLNPGWNSALVEPEGVSTGDYATIFNFDNHEYEHGNILGIYDDGSFEFEVIESSSDSSMSGQAHYYHPSQFGKVSNLGIFVHTPDEGYVPPDFTPLVKDDSPPLGDSDQEAIDIILHMKHEEALNWDNLADSVPVDSDKYAGTHVGAFMRDVSTDKVYYTKYPNDVEQARQEYVAYLLYKLAGVAVPEVKPIFQDGKLIGLGSKSLETDEFSIPQTSSELVEALDLLEAESPGMVRQFREGVVIDAWLGNRDFVGPGNVIIVHEGPEAGIYRIDYGGSLDYRAQGEKKLEGQTGVGLPFKVEELDSFLDTQYTTSKVLGSVYSERLHNFQSGINRLASISDDDILSVVYSVGLSQDDAGRIASTLIARRDNILNRWGDFVHKKSGNVHWESFNENQATSFLKRASKFFQVISKEAEYHLDEYKGVGYIQLNDWLRNGDKNIGKKSAYGAKMIEHLQGATKAMDEATKAFTFQTTTYLWRGAPVKTILKLPKTFDMKDTDALMKAVGGKDFQDKGFMSTSINKNVALNAFAGEAAFRLQVPPGYTSAIPGAKHINKDPKNSSPYIDSEFEFLLPRDTKFVVTGAYFDPTFQKTIVNVKVVPHSKFNPITSKQFIEVAKKYQQAPVIGADDEGLAEELVYSLKESMDLDDTEALITQLDRDTNDMLQMMVNLPYIPEESFKQINENHGKMVEQANGMTKGAFAALHCVMNNANV